MSLVPLLTEFDMLGDVEHMLEDPFALALHPMDILRPRYRSSLALHPHRRFGPYSMAKYTRPRCPELHCDKSEMIPTVGKEGFQVCMDVSQFTPNELTVKTVDRTVVVEGKHEEREDDHGFIQRHFIRKYTLPKGYDPKDVVTTMSSDGVLTVKAPPPPSKAKGSNERIVQIQQTGPAHLTVKQPEQPKAVSDKAANNCETEKMETK